MGRVIPSNSTEETPEDLFQKLKEENPLVYEIIEPYIPESYEEIPQLSLLILNLAVKAVTNFEESGGGKVALTIFGGTMNTLGVVVDITLRDVDGNVTKHDVARKVATAVAQLIVGNSITSGLAAIGISGGGFLLAAGLTAASMALIKKGYDTIIDPYSEYKENEDGSLTATTVLTFDEYFKYNWDDLNEFTKWELSSEKSSTKITYIADNLFEFSTSTIDEASFYRILSKSSNNFNVVWDSEGLRESDTVINYHHYSKEEILNEAQSDNVIVSQQALRALISHQPFTLHSEHADEYSQLDPKNFSETYLEDRALYFFNWFSNRHSKNLAYSTPGVPDTHFFDQKQPEKFLTKSGTGEEILRQFRWGDDEDNLIEMSTNGDHHLYGEGGHDTINGAGGNEHIEGGDGVDTINGNKGQDTILGGDDGDILSGGDEDDWIYGGSGNDRITGGTGTDYLFGGDNDDTFYIIGTDTSYDIVYGGLGYNNILGSEGDDTFRFNELTEKHSIQSINGLGGSNYIEGTEQKDTFDFSETNINYIDQIRGLGGSDYIKGSKSADFIFGGDGGDTLIGGGGADFLYGEEDIDRYVLKTGDGDVTIVDSGVNRIEYNGQLFSGVFEQISGTSSYEDKVTGKILTFNSPGVIQLDSETSLTFQNQTSAEDFENGDFGLTLLDETQALSTVVNVESNWYRRYWDTDNSAARILGEDNSKNYRIWGSEHTDQIVTADGNDQVFGHGEDDVISTKGGDDLIFDVGGSAIIRAGAGDDIVWGNSPAFDHFLPDLGRYFETTRLYDFFEDFVSDILYESGFHVWAELLGEDGYCDQFASKLRPVTVVDIGENAANLMQFNGVTYNSWDTINFSNYDYSFNFSYDQSTGQIRCTIDYSHATESGIVELPVSYVNWRLHNPLEKVGNLFIDGDSGDDHLVASDGNDHVVGGVGADEIFGLKGDDLLSGGQDDDFIAGGAGDDVILGEAGHDELIGEVGADIIYGGDGNDSIVADSLPISETEPSILAAFDGDDFVSGGNGDDSILGLGGNDELLGEGDDDAIWGHEGNDTLDGGEGQDSLSGGEGEDLLLGGDDMDFLYGGEDNDTLRGGKGRDGLDGGEGDDTYYIEYGDSIVNGIFSDTIEDESGDDTVVFEGIQKDLLNIFIRGTGDLFFQWAYNKGVLINGGMNGAIESFVFENTEYDLQTLLTDYLKSPINTTTDLPNATLGGGAAADSLTGTGGGSTFHGARGNDILTGAGGGNTYVYNVGDDSDTILDQGGQVAAPNIISFGPGITPDDISLSLSGTSLLILVGDDPNDSIKIDNFNPNDALSQVAIDEFHFENGDILTYEELLDIGFDLDESHKQGQVIEGTNVNDHIVGGNYGYEHLIGNAGDDYLEGRYGNDMLEGGAGTDTLLGGNHNDTLNGGQGSDLLEGGTGDDTLTGGLGDDTYIFSAGDGKDVVDHTLVESNSTETLQFTEGILSSDVVLERYANDLKVSFKNSSDEILIQGNFTGSSINQIEFYGGEVWGPAEIADKLEIKLSDASEVYIGTGAYEKIYGYAGNDEIHGNGGNDTIYGGVDNDTLYGGSGDNYLDGGDGDDTFVIEGHNAANLSTQYWGSAPADSTDIVLDSSGTDTLRFGTPEGVPGGNNSHMSFEEYLAGYASCLNIAFTRTATGLAIYYGRNFQNRVDIPDATIENFESADGSKISLSEVDAVLTSIASQLGKSVTDVTVSDLSGNPDYMLEMYLAWDHTSASMPTPSWYEGEILIGDAGRDLFGGHNGTDALVGMGGDDILAGFEDTDVLVGGTGDDTYLFRKGWGHDRITEELPEHIDDPWYYDQGLDFSYYGFYMDVYDDPALLQQMKDHVGSGYDTLVFMEDVQLSDLQVHWGKDGWGGYGIADNNDLLLTVGSEDDSVLINDYFAGAIEEIVLKSENRTLSHEEIMGLMISEGDDKVRGMDWAENSLDLGAGNDAVLGGVLNDQIAGGTGSDLLNGGKGGDTYHFELGDGRDVIKDGYYGTKVEAQIPEAAPGWTLTDDALVDVQKWGGREQAVEVYEGVVTGAPLDLSQADAGGYDKIQLGAGIQAEDVGFARWTEELWGHIHTISNDAWDGHQYNGLQKERLYIGYGDLVAKPLDDVVLNKIGSASHFNFSQGADLTAQASATAYANDIYLQDQYANGYSIEEVALADGSRITADAIKVGLDETAQYIADNQAVLEAIEAEGGNAKRYVDQILLDKWQRGTTVLSGTESDEAVTGQATDDQISTAGGNDTLTGGTGSDQLLGGLGDDTYIYNCWDGADTIQDAGGADTLHFGPGIVLADLVATLDPVTGDLTLGVIDEVAKRAIEAVGGTYEPDATTLKQKIVIQGWNDTATKIEAFTFDDTTSLTAAQLQSYFGLSGATATAPEVAGPASLPQIAEDGSTVVTTAELLAQASDPNGDPLSVENLSVDQGTLFDNGDGTWNYTPDADFNGTVHFSYQVSDGENITPATATLAVSAVNDAPVANGTVTYEELLNDQPTILTEAQLLSLVSDADGDTLSVINPTVDFGTLADNGDGTWTLTPDTGFSGQVTLSYEISDGTTSISTSASLDIFNGVAGTVGDDVQYGGTGNDLFQAGAGNDTLSADDGDDLLIGGVGNDTLYGGNGNDTYQLNLGDGVDTIYNEDPTGSDTLAFGPGITPADLQLEKNGNDLMITYGSGGDQVTIAGWYLSTAFKLDQFTFESGEVLSGTELIVQSVVEQNGTTGDDSLWADFGADIIRGGAGNDTLMALDGDDTLIGGTGNDDLTGGTGNDIYRFDIGDGSDRIFNDDATGTDTVAFGPGITPADLQLEKNGDDLMITYSTGGDKITIAGWYISTAFKPNQFTFESGEVLSGTELIVQSVVEQNGTAGDDSLWADFGADIIRGDAGNDTLVALDGDDTLIGGTGNDDLTGGTGNDTYQFNLGDGSDRVFNEDSAGVDTIAFGPGISPVDIQLEKNGNDLIVKYGNVGDQVTINGWYISGDFKPTHFSFESGETMTGAELIAFATITYSGTNGDDVLSGSWDSDTMYGFEGDDEIYGSHGNDVLIGGIGNDSLNGYAGDDIYRFSIGDGQDILENSYDVGSLDIIEFGAGIDVASIELEKVASDLAIRYGSDGDQVTVVRWFDHEARRIDQFKFADGSTITREELLAQKQMISQGSAGDDVLSGTSENDLLFGLEGNDGLYGGIGNDVLIGGVGNDTLNAYSGDDTYRFNIGDGQDTIDSYDTTGLDTIEFGAGITITDVELEKTGSTDLAIKYGAGTDQVTVAKWFNHDAQKIDQFKFADGSIVTREDLFAQKLVTVQGGTGDDVLGGTSESDLMMGLEGADDLYGGHGNDILIGGAGNDTLNAYSGDDTYRFNIGDGQDTIDSYDTAGLETVEFGAGITIADIELEKTGSTDLAIKYGAGTDQVTVAKWFNHDAQKIDQFRFSDGSVITREELFAQKLLAVNGGAGNDDLNGTSGNDILSGHGGADTLIGSSGDDVIIGGEGVDSLEGGTGDDTFIVEGLNASFDRITGGDGYDQILGGTGDDQIGLIEFRDEKRVERIDGGAGTNTIVGTGFNHLDFSETELVNIAHIDGGDGSDTIIGSSGDDVIIGGEGVDSLLGGAGDDTFIVDGQNASFDRITGGEGYDQILGGAGDDQIGLIEFRDEKRVERIDGGAGTNTIVGTGFNHLDFSETELINIAHIDGGDGADTIIGSSGNDVIIGGTWNDFLTGGEGNDTYQFSLGDGYDRVDNDHTSGSDKVSFDATVLKSEVGLYQYGDHLEIGYSAADTVQITNYFVQASYEVDDVALDDGSTMSSADINSIIDQMAAYASANGISLSSVNDVRNNEDLMAIIATGWTPAA